MVTFLDFNGQKKCVCVWRGKGKVLSRLKIRSVSLLHVPTIKNSIFRFKKMELWRVILCSNVIKLNLDKYSCLDYMHWSLHQLKLLVGGRSCFL